MTVQKCDKCMRVGCGYLGHVDGDVRDPRGRVVNDSICGQREEEFFGIVPIKLDPARFFRSEVGRMRGNEIWPIP